MDVPRNLRREGAPPNGMGQRSAVRSQAHTGVKATTPRRLAHAESNHVPAAGPRWMDATHARVAGSHGERKNAKRRPPSTPVDPQHGPSAIGVGVRRSVRPSPGVGDIPGESVASSREADRTRETDELAFWGGAQILLSLIAWIAGWRPVAASPMRRR